MKDRIKRSHMHLIIRIVISITALTLTTPLFAVEIEPSRIEISLPSGKVSSTLIKVTNWADCTVKINVKSDTYRYILTDGIIPPPEGKKKLPSCQNWLTFEPDEFKLSSKASIYIRCIIDVPENVKKEHVASILFDEEGLITTYEKFSNQPGNITLQVIPRFTIPTYITIKGEEIISAEISDIKILEGPTIGTMKTEITLHNKGTVHLRPSGSLIFMDSEGNISKTLPIGECLPIFPNYKEKIPVYYHDLLQPGNYTAVCTINIGGGKLIQKKAPFTVTEHYELE